MMTPIKTGDLLYAVGAGHNPPQDPADLCVYSTVVKNVCLEGFFGAGATYAIELNDDRPILGFPKWTYSTYEIGTTGASVHRSAADALRAFAEYVQMKHDEAARALARTDRQLKWVAEQGAL